MKIVSSFGRPQGKFKITKLKAKPWFVPVKIWLRLYHAGLLEEWVISRGELMPNLVVFNLNNGVNLFLQHLDGDTTYPLELDNASLGTGTTAPADTDTDLETPVVEGILRATSSRTVDSLVTEWFVTNDQLPNGTYTEFGIKCGTQLFIRALISPSHTKASGEDTLIEHTLTANNT